MFQQTSQLQLRMYNNLFEVLFMQKKESVFADSFLAIEMLISDVNFITSYHCTLTSYDVR